MNTLSAKSKIYLAILVWLALCAGSFGFLFKLSNSQSAGYISQLQDRQKQLSQLQAEEQSFKQAQADLALAAKKDRQPEDFFGRDITLVNEIQALEALGKKYSLQFSLTGVAGTIATVPKAKTLSELYQVPVTINLEGSFASVVGFVESLENLDFLVTVSDFSINSESGDNVTAHFPATFYIRK